MSIESFAATVTDNDGAAFITKAEFDSLKKEFQTRLDKYNTGIDSKIEQAINGYIQGVVTKKQKMLENRYPEYELDDGQLFKNLKWTNSTSFKLNACDRSSNQKDWQRIWTKMIWVNNGEYEGYDSTLWGKSGIAYANQGTQSSTSQNRIEVDKFDRIIAWGTYNIGYEAYNFQKSARDRSWTGIGAYNPVYFTTFSKSARRPWLWSMDVNTLGDDKYNARTDMFEIAAAKCFETMPSATETFNLSLVQIAPLSTAYEGRIGPQPSVSDTSDFTTVNNSSNTYGLRVISYNSFIYTDTDALRSTYNVSKHASSNFVLTNIAPRIYTDLEARWFDCQKYNEQKFRCIYLANGFDCPIKSGIPITTQTKIISDDKIIVKVENAAYAGYLVPYLSKTPDANWGGAKSNYTISKYQIAKNTKKEIELTVDEPGEYYLFVVWLPNTACVMPDLTLYHQTTQ